MIGLLVGGEKAKRVVIGAEQEERGELLQSRERGLTTSALAL
jgi:hypothetical protein